MAADTVWAEGCHSWYKNSEGRITNNWVSYTVDYRKRLARRSTCTTGTLEPV